MYENITLREYIESRLSSIEKALQLQAAEYMRRLDELNHAHQKAMEDKAEFLKKEVFEQGQKEVSMWRQAVQSALDKAEGAATVKAAMYAIGASLAVGVLILIIERFWR
jgi:hypothetical protein